MCKAKKWGGIIRISSKKRGVGTFDYFCIGFGAIVGVGWALTINNWMTACGGPVPAGIGYLLCLVIMVPVALCYCELCPMFPVAGGSVAYTYKAFGEKIAFISGWAVFGAMITMLPWEAIYFCDLLSILFPALKSGTPLYTIAGSGIYLGHIVLGVLFSLILFLINRRGVAVAATFQRILCIALIGAGLLAIVAALFKFDAGNWQPIYENISGASHNSLFTGALAILASAPFFLSGFETIPQAIEAAGGNIKRVGKTVVTVVVLACLFYALLLFSLGGAVPWQDFAQTASPAVPNMFRLVYSEPTGSLFYYIILAGAICGMLTTWNGFFMASSLLMMSLSRGRMIPRAFAKQHPKYGTPTNALLLHLAVSCVGPFLGMGLIAPLTSFSAAGFVCSWAFTAFSLIRLRKRMRDAHRPYKIPGGTIVAWFASLVMSIIFVLLFIPDNPVFMGTLACVIFASWMAVGMIMFFAAAKQRRKFSPQERAETFFVSNGDIQEAKDEE